MLVCFVLYKMMEFSKLQLRYVYHYNMYKKMPYKKKVGTSRDELPYKTRAMRLYEDAH